jgi:dimethylglycine dehydrogenase
MKDKVRIAVVGGGIVGCSIAYHLAKFGWKDVVLFERDELTAGSTWHAAGLLPLFNMSYATSHIHNYSVDFYEKLAKEVSMDTGLFRVGNLRMAQTDERIDEFKLYASTAETVGVECEWLTQKQLKERWPLLRTEDLKGAIFHPTDGYINSADVTQALAKGARMRGVEIYRKTQVNDFLWQSDGTWLLQGTEMKDIGGKLVAGEPFSCAAEIVISATGNHAQRTAAAIGTYIPTVPVEHQYVVTEPDPELVEWRKNNPEHPVLRDADAKWYVREERGGWILGPYEKGAVAWGTWGVPENFRADLLPLDLERIETEYMSMIHRLPSTETLGIKDDFNGPISYTPDGNPLVGPAPGVSNFYFAEGFSFGITAAGGVGYYLAQMLTEGEAEIDMWSLDPRRFGKWVTHEYSALKNIESYEHVYILHHPDEERTAARPLRTAPCYDRVKARGACFGQVNGWERPNYYADKLDFDDRASCSFRRGGWWGFVKAEAVAVREGVGLFDATAFTKHMISGPGATRFLDWLTCNKLPKVGRINLTYGLTDVGTIRTEFTIVRLLEDEYYVVTSGAAQAYDSDYMIKQAELKREEFGWIQVYDVSNQYGVLALAGPGSRDVMKAIVSGSDPENAFRNKAFPWLSAKSIELGMCRCLAIRVAYTGELGWELHHPIEMQNYLFDRIMSAGEPLGLRLCGARSQNWLRQEKSYRAFGSDLGRDATPIEAALDRFVDMNKDFKGKEAMIATGKRVSCVTVLIDGPSDADPWGREALYHENGRDQVGRLTSGGYSVAFGKQIGIGYVGPELSVPGTKLRLRMFNELWDAVVTEESPYDPKNETIRKDG